MHTEKRAPSEGPRQHPLGAVVWGFIVASVAIAGIIFYNIPSAIRSIDKAMDDGNLLPVSLFYGLIQGLGLWLFTAAVLLIKRHRWALPCTRGSLLFSMCLMPLLAGLLLFIHFDDFLYRIIFSINVVTTVSLYFFIKKYNFLGVLLAAAGIVGAFFITNSLTGLITIFYASAIHVTLCAFLLLYYFTHSAYMKELSPGQLGVTMCV